MYTLILNPISGHEHALKVLPAVEALLQRRALAYCVKRSSQSEGITAIAARAAAEKPEGIIAIGGDGTLFEIVNGLPPRCDVPLLFVSCGTGNDFIKSLKLPRDPIAALELQLDAPVKRIDLCRMNDMRFLNVAGTGFDVDVLNCLDKYKSKYTGLRAYMRALVDAVKHYRPTVAQVSIDDGPEQEMSFAILSIGNGRYIGGGMKAVPDALVDDGLFDVVIVKPVRRCTILPLIAFFVGGQHVRFGLGRAMRCKRLRIRCSGMTVNMDGELRNTDTAEFELIPGGLCVRVPEE